MLRKAYKLYAGEYRLIEMGDPGADLGFELYRILRNSYRLEFDTSTEQPGFRFSTKTQKESEIRYQTFGGDGEFEVKLPFDAAMLNEGFVYQRQNFLVGISLEGQITVGRCFTDDDIIKDVFLRQLEAKNGNRQKI